MGTVRATWGQEVRDSGEGGQGLSSDWDREGAEVAGHHEHGRQWDVPTATSKGRRKWGRGYLQILFLISRHT